MTKFEQVGVNFQHNACTKEQARRSFDYSCTCCCNRGMHIDCDHCAIAAAHKLTIAALDTKLQEVVIK